MKKLPEENQLRKRLLSYSEDPDAQAWDEIAAAITLQGGNRNAAWIWLAILLLISVTGITGYFILKTDGTSNDAMVTVNELPLKSASEHTADSLAQRELRQEKAYSPVSTVTINQVPVNSTDEAVSIEKTENKSLQSPDVEISDESTEVVVIEPAIEAYPVQMDSVRKEDEPEVMKTDSVIQNENDTPVVIVKKKKKGFHPSIYFSVSPSLAFQKIIPDKTDQLSIVKLNPTGVYSADRLGIGVDAGFRWTMSRKLDGYAGLSYYQQNSTIDYTVNAPNSVQPESSGNLKYLLTPGYASSTFVYKMKNSGVSAGVFYLLQGDRLRHKLGIGLQYQAGFLSSEKNSTYHNSESQYLNYQIMYRFEFTLSARMEFFIQPSFTHLLFSQESLTEPFSIVPYRVGVGIGMVYHF